MASSIVQGVAWNPLRVRAMASSSHLYNTRCFQYDKKRDFEDVCILKSDSKPGSVAHDLVNYAFDSCVSPRENLLRLINCADGINGMKYGMHKAVPWWHIEEDEKSVNLLRALPTQSEEYPSEIDLEKSETSIRHKEFRFSIHPDSDENMSCVLHTMRQQETEQSKSEPLDYYFNVMHDKTELPRMGIPMTENTRGVRFSFNVSYNLQNPQAIRIIFGLKGLDAADQETDDPFQGYAFEIFLPEGVFNVQDAKQYQTDNLWKIRIPKKKGESIQTVGGNLLFFYTKDIPKPTMWRPT